MELENRMLLVERVEDRKPPLAPRFKIRVTEDELSLEAMEAIANGILEAKSAFEALALTEKTMDKITNKKG